MSAFTTRALTRRPYAAVIVCIAIACAIAIAIATLHHSGSSTQPLTPRSIAQVSFRQHNPGHRHHHPASNAGYGLVA